MPLHFNRAVSIADKAPGISDAHTMWFQSLLNCCSIFYISHSSTNCRKLLHWQIVTSSWYSDIHNTVRWVSADTDLICQVLQIYMTGTCAYWWKLPSQSLSWWHYTIVQAFMGSPPLHLHSPILALAKVCYWHTEYTYIVGHICRSSIPSADLE